MPGLDGYEVARKVRARPGSQPALLIAITGWGQRDDKARALAAGFDYHFTKPVDPVTLETVLRQTAAPGHRV